MPVRFFVLLKIKWDRIEKILIGFQAKVPLVFTTVGDNALT